MLFSEPQDGLAIEYQPRWFDESHLGPAKQVAGIAAHPAQPIVAIFHRHNVVWDAG